MLIFVKDGTPPEYVFTADAGPAAQQLALHPDWTFCDDNIIIGLGNPKQKAAEFNAAMELYKQLLIKYPPKEMADKAMDRHIYIRDKGYKDCFPWEDLTPDPTQSIPLR